MRNYIDSDILIWHLRGKKTATEFLRAKSSIEGNQLFLGAMQRAEIVFFMKPSEEEITMSLLAQFKTHPVNQVIVDLAGVIYRNYNPSHGIDPNDALLAATVMHTGGRIYTLNEKHFPMPEIVAQRPW